MADKTIAVLGGGNGAHTMAVDLTMKGYAVNLCEMPEFEENIKVPLERQAVNLIDPWGEKHTVSLNRVTTDFKQALEDVEYIMVTVPAIGAERFFDAFLPHLKDGQTIVKWSANFSALAFASILRDKGIRKDITLAESHTLPWGCRIVEPGTVQIMVWAVKMLLAALPAENTARVIRDVHEMYPVVPAENVLASTLNNLNPIVHPVGTVMNAGWVDAAGRDFYFYRDGNTLSISRCIKKVYEEVRGVAEAVGVTMLDYPEEDFWKKSSIMSTYFRASFDKEGAVAKISGPPSVKSRYITEDLPFGLVPIKKLALAHGVATPLIDAVISLSSIINQTDYMKEGLSLKHLGIDGLTRDALNRFLETGER
jgi:opine dehydrogenase